MLKRMAVLTMVVSCLITSGAYAGPISCKIVNAKDISPDTVTAGVNFDIEFGSDDWGHGSPEQQPVKNVRFSAVAHKELGWSYANMRLSKYSITVSAGILDPTTEKKSVTLLSTREHVSAQATPAYAPPDAHLFYVDETTDEKFHFACKVK